MIDKTLMTLQMGLFYQNFTPYFQVFNDVTMRLFEAGITDHISAKTGFYPKALQRPEDEIGPQVLNMDHLEIGFLACCVVMVVAALVFLLEVIVLIWCRLRNVITAIGLVLTVMKLSDHRN